MSEHDDTGRYQVATKPQTRATYSDLLEMYPEVDNVRRELIDGELIVSASPVKRHQAVVLKMGRANSSGRCNNDFKSISRRLVTECLARARVETQSHRVKVSLTVA